MTVIAFREGVMAGDTGVFDSEGNLVDHAEKVFTLDDLIIGLCGWEEPCLQFKSDLLENQDVFAREAFLFALDNVNALIYERETGEVYYMRGKEFMKQMDSRTPLALGAGRQVAARAMAAGATPAAAVQAAIQQCPAKCGGSITEMK